MKQEGAKGDDSTKIKTTPSHGGGANLLNLCIESTPCPVLDTNDVMLDNRFPFSMLNNDVLIVDEQVTFDNSVVNTNVEEKVDEDYLLYDNERTNHIFYNKE